MTRRTRVPLEHPVIVDGLLYSELELAPFTRADRLRLDLAAVPAFEAAGGETGRRHAIGIAMIARMARVTPEVMYALDKDDAERVGQAAQPMLGGL